MASLEEKKKMVSTVVSAPSSANLPTYLALAAAGLALGLSFIIFREIKRMRVIIVKLEKDKVPTDLTEKINASDAYTKEISQKLDGSLTAMQRMQAQQQQIAQQYQLLASEVAQKKFGKNDAHPPMDQFRMGSGAAKVNGNNTEEVELDSESEDEEPKTKKTKKKTSG